jgi:tetratricopeptide (TPR) repeat protein
LEYDFTEDGIYLTDAALKITPYSSELWHSKGIFYNNLFEFEKAYLCFDKALSLNPGDVEAMINKSIAEDNLGMSEDAANTLHKALHVDPNHEEILFNLGILFEKKNSFQDAISYFKKTLAVDNEYGDAWYELGYCYENNDQLFEAAEAYEKFLEIEPYSASGWYNFGIVQLRAKNYQKAINCFELATAVNDEFSNAWYNCGLAYSKINRYKDSRNAFLKAFEIDPFDELIPLNIANSFEATGDYGDAISYYYETLKLSKSNIEALIGLGNCYARKNERLKMLECFSLIIRYSIDKNYSELPYDYLVSRLNNVFNTIKKIEDSNLCKENLSILAESYFELGNWNKAIIFYEGLLRYKTEKGNAYYGRALCNFMLGQNEKALEDLIYSFELNPSNEIKFLDDFPYFDSTQLYIKLTDSI